MNNDYDDSFVAESLPAFVSEAQEHIEMLEQLLLQLETQPDNRELLDALFRSAHTIKGSAGIFGLDKIVAFTHHVETLLDGLRASQQALTPTLSTLLLQCNDQIRLLVNAAQGTNTDTDTAARTREALIEQLRSAYGESADTTPQPANATSPKSGVLLRRTISVAFNADTFRNGMDPLAILNYVGGMGSVPRMHCDMAAVPTLQEIDPESCHLAFEFMLDSDAGGEQIEAAFSFVRDDCTLAIGDALPAVTDATFTAPLVVASPDNIIALPDDAQLEVIAPVAATSVTAPNTQQNAPDSARKPSDENRFIRVQADRLDHVINLLGELVIATAGASLLARHSRSSTLIEANQQITSLVEEIRNGTLQLRMVPIGETFSRFRRVVRDTAAQLGKNIVLEIVGGETELDKSVVEHITDPLMHLVRNALDHGIETPEQRLATGKPAQGCLTLSARHESGSILICISDDGGGINRDKVLARAWERGLVEPGTTPPDADILKLIFQPGFSTAETVTNLSGRGVGMDVVRRNIEVLRGTINLFSTQGEGSRIEIRLPLTLAIIDGFLVSVGASKFVFPLDCVVEVIESRATSLTLDARGRSIVELRNQILPVVSLRSLYALDSPEPERSSIVVIHVGEQRFGVLVDQLHGQHQTVIKPLGQILRSLRGVSGSSILGSGEVALIFDVHSLCQLAVQPLATFVASATANSNAPSHLQL